MCLLPLKLSCPVTPAGICSISLPDAKNASTSFSSASRVLFIDDAVGVLFCRATDSESFPFPTVDPNSLSINWPRMFLFAALTKNFVTPRRHDEIIAM